ncbi:MAG: hypothetical protein Q8N56_04370 [bacterium]|nr:hypothetical protein [bacterium]
MIKKNSEKGFTLLELSVVVGIIILLTVLVTPSLNYFRANSALNDASEEIISVLSLAKNKAVSSEGPSRWGVYFDFASPQKYILFKGSSFVSRDQSADVVHNLPPSVEFSAIDLYGGATETVFSRINGATQQFGSLSLWIKNNHTKTAGIYIDSMGIVQSIAVAPPSDEIRLKDFRHTHLTYSRTIAIATEKVKLTFSDGVPVVIQEISFAENIEKNQFFWEGEVLVGGAVQKIKIHTTELNNPETVFCLHRDGQENNASLEIDLSGDTSPSPNLIGYSADGFLTAKGSSIFVSDPLPQ